MVKVHHVPAGDLTDIWDQIRPLVDVFCRESSGRYLPDNVMMQLVTGTWDLWVAEDATGVTSMLVGHPVKYPGRKAYEPIGVVGKDARAWVGQLGALETWARSYHGCSLLRITAPFGWERLLGAAGWKKPHVVLEKDI